MSPSVPPAPPTASAPEELGDLFTSLLAAGDVDTLAGLYTDDAVFVPSPGQTATGRDQVREALAGMHAAGARVSLELRHVHVVGDTAVLSNTATVTTPGALPMVTVTTEVVLRSAGAWRYLVDDPFFSA